MSQAQDRPSDNELQAFLTNLGQYRSTLSEGDQQLLDSMVGAALGKTPRRTRSSPSGTPTTRRASGPTTRRGRATPWAGRTAATP